jgi:hypothetical protein
MSKESNETVKKDALGGRIGSRMSAINRVVIAAGAKGATVEAIAQATGEKRGTINGQLGWLVSFRKLATRTEEKTKDGKKTFRYFVKT